MINRLNIRNFALIDNLEIELSPGLNVLTGETGAGKSIIIDAMGVIIGTAGLQEYIRTGEDKALVEALFDISGYHYIAEKLNDFGLESEDYTLLLTRELQRNGKNLCRINGRPVTLSMYREIGELLVDIYGQNHQQSLLRKEKHLLLLDSFGGEKLKKMLRELASMAEQYSLIRKKLLELRQNETDKARRQDTYNFQLEEIEGARLRHDEEEQLNEERNLLANAERLADLAQAVYELLYHGSSNQLPVLDLLHKAYQNLKDLGAIDPAMEKMAIQLEGALYQVEDCARETGRYREKISFDPHRLDAVMSRLEKIRQLKRKYGASITEILKYREEIAAALHQLTYSEVEITELSNAEQQIYQDYCQLAAALSEHRKRVASKIETEICRELIDLNMPETKFKVSFGERKEVNNLGSDDVEFLISPNLGEPLKPLSKIASGGEISRIMLAMKTTLARVDEIPTMIFDEIDAGLGGRAVHAVARKLSLIGKNRQVICVTHSPQIASHAHFHFSIDKESREHRTVTIVRHLMGEHRVQEIARMLGGNNVTSTTKKSAAEMLELAKSF